MEKGVLWAKADGAFGGLVLRRISCLARMQIFTCISLAMHRHRAPLTGTIRAEYPRIRKLWRERGNLPRRRSQNAAFGDGGPATSAQS